MDDGFKTWKQLWTNKQNEIKGMRKSGLNSIKDEENSNYKGRKITIFIKKSNCYMQHLFNELCD